MHRNQTTWRRVLAAGLTLICINPLQAQQPEPETNPTPTERKLSLTPRAVPEPALKYSLTYSPFEQKEGNAALAYQQAFAQWSPAERRKEIQKAMKDADADEDVLESITKVPRSLLYDSTLDAIKKATRYAECNWQLPIAEEGFQLKLPHYPKLKGAGQLLGYQVQRAIAEGDVDETMSGLRAMLAMARHTAEGPTLIESLVALAIGNLAMEKVERLIQTDQAPNLYWALSDLPSPLISARDAVLWEREGLFLVVPELRNLEEKELEGPAAWNDLFHHTLDKVERTTEGQRGRGRFSVALRGAAFYPGAVERLVDRGYNRAKVEAMPVGKVLLLDGVQSYKKERDDEFKWASIPYWQAVELEDSLERARSRGRRSDVLGFMRLVPAIFNSFSNFAKFERAVAVLRCVEAIRHYAATHHRYFPSELEDISGLPVPDNPMTGRPFEYRVESARAILEVRAHPSKSTKDDYRYILELK